MAKNSVVNQRKKKICYQESIPSYISNCNCSSVCLKDGPLVFCHSMGSQEILILKVFICHSSAITAYHNILFLLHLYGFLQYNTIFMNIHISSKTQNHTKLKIKCNGKITYFQLDLRKHSSIYFTSNKILWIAHFSTHAISCKPHTISTITRRLTRVMLQIIGRFVQIDWSALYCIQIYIPS